MSRAGKVWQRGRKAGDKRLPGVPWYFVVDVKPAGATRRQQVWKGGYRTEAEARAALNDVLSQVQNGAFTMPSKITFGAYLERWLDGLVTAGRRPSTIAGHRAKLDLYVIPRLGDVPLQQLTALDLDGLYAELLKRGGRKRGDRKDQPLSARTVRLTHSIVGKALADAERKGLVARNVARLASPPSSTAAKAPEMTAWTPAELRAFLDLTADHHHGTLFRLAAMAGLRRAELCGLRWADVDLDAGTLTVRRTITTVDHQPVEGDVKTRRSRRTIDLDPTTVAVLRRHRTAQLEQRMMMGSGFTDRGLVFAMPDGRCLHPDVVTRAFDRLVKASDLPRISLHGLRHTHASHLLGAGVNVKVVSERLGHASTAFTLDIYAHTMPGQQADAAAAAAALVDGL